MRIYGISIFALLTATILAVSSGTCRACDTSLNSDVGCDTLDIPNVDKGDQLPPDDGQSTRYNPQSAKGNSRPGRPKPRPNSGGSEPGREDRPSKNNPNEPNVYDKLGVNKEVEAQELKARPIFLKAHNTFRKQCLSINDSPQNPYLQSLFRYVDGSTQICRDTFGGISYQGANQKPIKLLIGGRSLPIAFRNSAEQDEVSKIVCRIIGYKGNRGVGSSAALTTAASYDDYIALSEKSIAIIPQWDGYAIKLEHPKQDVNNQSLVQYSMNVSGKFKDYKVNLFHSISCGAPSPYRPYLLQSIQNPLFWSAP